MTIRIIIADDQKIIRASLRDLLDQQINMEVVAEAEDGHEAVELARKFPPDVLIMDIVMPTLNGIEATRQIKIEAPDVKIIALSMYGDSQYVKGMLDAGASGYLLKKSAFKELIQAIRAVTAGQSYLGLGMTNTSGEKSANNEEGVNEKRSQAPGTGAAQL